MNIAISGSNGFIGSRLIVRLEESVHNVIPINRNFIHSNNLKAFLIDNKIEVFYHLSAYGNHYGQDKPFDIINSNCFALENVLYCCDKANVKTVYNFSTSSVSLEKQTMYSLSKRLGEEIVNNFKSENTKAVNIRPYSVYGPGEADHRFIPTVIKCLLTGGEMPLDPNAHHDWIYIQDAIDLLLSGETNLGTGISFSNIEVVKILENISNQKLNFTKSKLRSYDCKIWKADKILKLNHSLEEGLFITYKYYEQKFKETHT